jgi:secreted PhoX family phosphatase
MSNVTNQRYARRSALRGPLAVSTIGSIAGPQRCSPRVSFSEIEYGADGTHHVSEGHNVGILIRGGPGALDFAPHNQTSCAQEQKFGYNNDYPGYLPLPVTFNNSDHRLLFVNHDYTNE